MIHIFTQWHTVNLKKVGRHFSNLPKCNPFQSSPVLSIHVPSWLSWVLLEFFYQWSQFWAVILIFYLILWPFHQCWNYLKQRDLAPLTPVTAQNVTHSYPLWRNCSFFFLGVLCASVVFLLVKKFIRVDYKRVSSAEKFFSSPAL